MVDISIRITGAAGQGLQSTGKMFGKACVKSGYYVFGIQDSMSRIRGGHNYFQLRISNKEIIAQSRAVELLLPLDKLGVTTSIVLF